MNGLGGAHQTDGFSIPADTCGISVLVVEDDRFQIEGILDNLIVEGFRAVGVHSADEALRVIDGADRPFELGLFDIDLPGSMNGIDLLQYLRGRCPDMQMVVLSGKATLDHAVQALNLGAFGFVYKPYDPEHLVTTLRQAHDRMRLLQLNSKLLNDLVGIRNDLLAGEATPYSNLVGTNDRMAVLRAFHEISNQLQLLLHLTESIRQRAVSVGSVERVAERMLDVIDRTANIIAEVRTSITYRAATLQVPCVIVDIVASVLAQMEPFLHSRDVSITFVRPERRFEVFVNRLHIEQVFVNLFTNACEAMPGGGSVTIDFELQFDGHGRAFVVTRIVDDGPGIPGEILDDFGTKRLSTKPGGQGLGLFLVRSIIERHDGWVLAANLPTEGAKLEIGLPSSASIG